MIWQIILQESLSLHDCTTEAAKTHSNLAAALGKLEQLEEVLARVPSSSCPDPLSIWLQASHHGERTTVLDPQWAKVNRAGRLGWRGVARAFASSLLTE